MFSIVTAPISIPTNSAQGVSFLHIQHLLSLYSLYFHPISQRANFFFLNLDSTFYHVKLSLPGFDLNFDFSEFAFSFKNKETVKEKLPQSFFSLKFLQKHYQPI